MPSIELADLVSELPREQWDALVGGDGSPFLEWDWLASLEDSGCVGEASGWRPAPLVAREAGRLIAACPLYVKAHSEGEFVFDWGWADAAERAGIRYYPKLLVGVPFTPVAGARLLVAPGRELGAWRRRLADQLRSLCLENGLSGVHVNFCLPEEQDALSESGFLLRTGIQYHWHNANYEDFEQYLARFRSKRRNQIRRERRELERQGVRIEVRAGEEIPDSLIESMFRFYESTVKNHFYGRQYLNRELFELLRSRFGRRLVFIVAFQGAEAIAGTLNILRGKALYGRYWGATRPMRHLHFNVCYYAAIEYCIAEGISRFEPGAGGDYKQLRGFDAQPTWSAHFLSDPRLADAVARSLEQERAEADRTIEWLRDASALKARPSKS